MKWRNATNFQLWAAAGRASVIISQTAELAATSCCFTSICGHLRWIPFYDKNQHNCFCHLAESTCCCNNFLFACSQKCLVFKTESKRDKTVRRVYACVRSLSCDSHDGWADGQKDCVGLFPCPLFIIVMNMWLRGHWRAHLKGESVTARTLEKSAHVSIRVCRRRSGSETTVPCHRAEQRRVYCEVCQIENKNHSNCTQVWTSVRLLKWLHSRLQVCTLKSHSLFVFMVLSPI